MDDPPVFTSDAQRPSEHSRPYVVRLAGAVALLALIVVGLRRPELEFLSGGRAEDSSSALTEVLAWILVPLACCVAIPLLVAGVRLRRVLPAGKAAQGWLAALLSRVAGLLALGAIGLAIWMVFRDAPADDESTAEAPPPPATADPGVEPSRPAGGSDGTFDLVLTIGAAAVVGAIAAAVVIWRRRRREATVQDGQPDAAALADAVQAGRRALRESDDDRAAIIACYAAMEAAFARHGVQRDRSDTAGDHLSRATEAGLVTVDAVRELVAVFGRARFSGHPIRPGDRASAERVLDAVRVQLGEPA